MSQTSLQITPEYVETYKYNKWEQYYTDDKNPKTYSNATQSALAAYGNITYSTAHNIAVDNLKKFRYKRYIFAEKNGFTLEKFQKATISKFLKSDKPDWYEKVKEVTGLGDVLPQLEKGQGVSIKTENKDGTVSEIKIINFERPKEEKSE